ncbi:hypothetical protein DEO72_LG7g1291 [Vigna unguiculata]|uniref:Uncharacterized protein n=1 Tax=Vigna unguiculata TaxID=3917 RepID=A0A4D6MJW6_VIGUN|nr:hypothetical protein DEO72_LG7g1291 [Vigna unguiculata]
MELESESYQDKIKENKEKVMNKKKLSSVAFDFRFHFRLYGFRFHFHFRLRGFQFLLRLSDFIYLDFNFNFFSLL